MTKEELKNKDTILALIGILFFIALAFVARTTITKEQKPKEEPKPTATNIEESDKKDNEQQSILESLKQTNYHFTYTITENGQTEMIDGKANANKMKFTIFGNQKEEYAKLSDNYLKLINGKYEIIKNEIRPYFKYITLDEVEKILNESLSKKEDETLIFTVDVIDLLDQYTEIEYTGFEEFKDDQIKVLTQGNQITKIEIDYSNYFSYMNKTTSSFQVVMEFRDFGNIEELEI